MTTAQAATLLASWTALATFTGSAIYDLMTRRIPNTAVMVLLGAFALYALAAGLPLASVGLHLVVAVAAFAVGAGCFAAGWLGGGDVKLAAAVLLWAGPSLTPLVFMVTGAVGIIVALTGYLIQRLEPASGGRLPAPVSALSASRGVPYGIGLSIAGGLAVLSYS